MTINLDLIDNITLGRGSHPSRKNGLCLMEAVAYVAGKPHTAQPPCVSPLLGNFGRTLNDMLDYDQRQELKPLIPLLIGTADDGMDEQRGYLALDWLVRTYAPAWLDLAGLPAEAAELRALARIVDPDAMQTAEPAVRASTEKAHEKSASAGNANWEVVGSTILDVVWSVAWATASSAGWHDPWGLAWEALSAATRVAGRDAMWPTTDQLQDSAIDLFTRMCRPDQHEEH